MFGFGSQTSAIEHCADAVLKKLLVQIPPADERLLGEGKLQPALNLGKAANQIERVLREFAASQSIGVWTKARLLNRLKWKMNACGYSTTFIDATLAEVTLMLTRIKSRRSG